MAAGNGPLPSPLAPLGDQPWDDLRLGRSRHCRGLFTKGAELSGPQSAGRSMSLFHQLSSPLRIYLPVLWFRNRIRN